MKKHPDSKLTLRECWEKHYDKSEMRKSSIRNTESNIKRWERMTGDPPVCEITNETLAAFRQAMLDEEYAAWSINGTWWSFRAILRRIGPKFTGNPWGLGIIPDVPAMKPVRGAMKPPRRLDLDDIARIYVACRHADFPRCGVHPADWWRALLVVAYCTGLRKSDIFGLTWHNVDFQRQSLQFTAEKTGRMESDFPLHPCVLAHLERMKMTGTGKIFRGLYCSGDSRTGSFYKRFHRIQEIAQVERMGLHDLRRAGCCEVERVRPGMAPVFLQHKRRDVTNAYYLNQTLELKEAIEAMRLPAGFQSGPKVAAKRLEEVRQARLAMRQEDFIVPDGPDPRDWKFRPGAFAFRGTWYPLKSEMRRIVLQLLAMTPRPVHWSELAAEIRRVLRTDVADPQLRVQVTVSDIRKRLRKCLGLDPMIDPVPCVQRGNGPTGGKAAWTIWIPPEVNRERKAQTA